MTYFVYKITNRVNGKAYIGVTNNPKRRFSEHKSYARSKVKKFKCALYDAMLKYGFQNFSFDVLAECYSEKELMTCERALISTHNTWAKFGAGYNITLGGEGTYGRIISQETRDKLSAAKRGKKHSAESRARMSESQMGKKHGPLPDAVKEKMRVAKIGKITGDETKKKISTALTGRKLSVEMRGKISRGLKIVFGTEEGRAKQSAKMKGKSRSAEDRAARVEMTRKSWIKRRAKKRENLNVIELFPDKGEAA